MKWDWTSFTAGMFIVMLIVIAVNVFVHQSDEYNNWYYQQGWCDGSSKAITANYDLWACYHDFGDFFFINESKWNMTCYDENLLGYYDVGYKMAGCHNRD